MDRKIVAAFIADIYRDMVKETQYGTIMAAKRFGVKLLFFASFSDNFSNAQYSRLSNYDIGDSAIYKLPNLQNFDGLITYDSYMPSIFIKLINDLKEKAPCPVVTLGDIKDCSYNVVNDQDLSFREVIEHTIKVHGCKELIHIAGNPELSFVQDRIRVFKQTLEDNGLPYDDSRILYGTLWYDSAQRVTDELLKLYEKNEKQMLPDAIICANDYTAIGVADELIRRGFRIPEDTIITGYDDVIQAKFNEPSITTSAQPFEQVGKDGIGVLEKIWNNEPVDHVTAEPGILRRRQSCGCEEKHQYQQDDLRESYAAVIERLGNLSRSNTNLILSVSSAETNKDVFDEIEANCRKDTGFKDAVLCLINGWDQHKIISEPSDFDDAEFEVVCGIYNDRSIRREKLPKGQLLPSVMLEDNEAYYLVPIHHLQYFMGYFIISPDLENLSQLNIKSWFINVSSMLENWRVKQKLKITVERLENLYMTDMLTGLYNRRGYGNHFQTYYEESLKNKSSIAVFLIDMDNMKLINDNFGHDEGDYCLCTIGKAMKFASKDNEVCIRSGGDEFVVLAKNYDEDKVTEFSKTLREYLDNSCKTDKKPFSISVSIGCYIQTPTEDEEKASSITDISERYLREADALMYLEKKEHKKKL